VSAERLSGSVEVLKGAGTGRRFRMLAYTGAEITRAYGKAIGDLSGIFMPSKLPILLNHDENAVVGYADRHEVTARGLELSGVILESEPAGLRIVQLSASGYPLTASIGCTVERVERVEEGKSVRCNGRDVSGPATVWRKVRLFETSFITANPADKNTTAEALSARGRTPSQVNEGLALLVDLALPRASLEVATALLHEQGLDAALASVGMTEASARGYLRARADGRIGETLHMRLTNSGDWAEGTRPSWWAGVGERS
jgi:hypothetical protein